MVAGIIIMTDFKAPKSLTFVTSFSVNSPMYILGSTKGYLTYAVRNRHSLQDHIQA